MRLTPAEVDHIATLSRLELSDAERERAATELSQIIGYFESLGELDTENVAPTMHALPVENVLRADEVQPGLSREAALQQRARKRRWNVSGAARRRSRIVSDFG